jgi:DNA polymerase-3 subunit delta'
MRDGLCPDVRLIGCADGRKTIGVETVRELARQAYITSNEFSFRMFIIEDAELMTASAQNAFLKLFEEPPQGVYFVLLCLSASMLLPTVRSRAQLLRTERCRDEDIRRYLIASSPRAATLARDGAAELDRIILSAEGSIGEAMRLLARSGVSDKAREISDGVIRAVTSRSGVAIMLSVSRLSSDRSEAADILELVLDGLRELLFARCCDDGQDGTLPNTSANMGTDLARESFANVWQPSARLATAFCITLMCA